MVGKQTTLLFEHDQKSRGEGEESRALQLIADLEVTTLTSAQKDSPAMFGQLLATLQDLNIRQLRNVYEEAAKTERSRFVRPSSIFVGYSAGIPINRNICYAS